MREIATRERLIAEGAASTGGRRSDRPLTGRVGIR